MSRILIVDNYDSFTYNLYQLLGSIQKAAEGPFSRGKSWIKVVRNDRISVQEIEDALPTHLVISPGPGDPRDARYFGVCGELLQTLSRRVPTIGVCLGMQGIAACFGGEISRSPVPFHGKTSLVEHDGSGLFERLPQRFEVMRYHSLEVDIASLPDELEVTATVATGPDGDPVCMGLRHREYPIEGLQFHPESYATQYGREILAAFVRRTPNQGYFADLGHATYPVSHWLPMTGLHP